MTMQTVGSISLMKSWTEVNIPDAVASLASSPLMPKDAMRTKPRGGGLLFPSCKVALDIDICKP